MAANYAGSKITKIKFYPLLSVPYTVKVWTGGSGATVVASQAAGTVTANQWNEVTLTNPVHLQFGVDYWIGYTVTQQVISTYPAAMDDMAHVENGDMVNLGSTWQSIFTASDGAIDGNWLLKGIVEDENRTMVFDSRNLQGFKIYHKEGAGGSYELLGTSNAITQSFTHITPTNHMLHYYQVTSLFDGVESNPSNESSNYMPTQNSNEFIYDDGTAENGFSHTGFIANRLHMVYTTNTAVVKAIKFFIHTKTASNMILKVWEAGEDNLPGEELYTQTISPAMLNVGWNYIIIPEVNQPTLSSGNIFIGFQESTGSSKIGVDSNNYGVSVRKTNTTSWTAVSEANYMIRAYITGVIPSQTYHFIPVWTGNGLQYMNFYIISALLDNEALEYGDEIAVFDGQYCVGSYRINNPDLSNYAFVASLDDPETFLIDGYTVGHNISYRVWKNSTQMEYSDSQVTVSYISGNQTFTISGTAQVNISAISSVTQNINLNSGWNIMSINTLPSNLTMPSVFSGLMSNNLLIKMQNESGQAFEYLSAIGQWINNIGSVSSTEGYYIKVNTNCQFSVTGMPVTLPLSVPLSNGWNIMSYPYQYAQSAMPLLQNLINNNQLVKVMNESGQAIEYLPVIGWINNINNFNPGEGYSIKVNQNVNLNYPNQRTNEITLADMQMTAKRKLSQPVHFVKNWSGNGYKHHNFYIIANDYLNSMLNNGDEIAVFDGENCVASVVVNGEETYYSLIASMREIDSEIANGYTKDHSFTISIYSNQNEYSNVSFEVVTGETSFSEGSSTAIQINNLLSNDNLLMPKLTEIKSIYPNPFNPTTTIQYSLNKNDKVEIDIYNIKGQKVKTLISSHQNAGNYQVTWYGKDHNEHTVSSGIYFCKLRTSDKLITKKMIMVK